MLARNTYHILSLSLLVAMTLTACNATKFVPEDKYLLNKVHVRVEDTKKVSSSDLSSYLRQKPNSEVLGFWKLQLDIYNTAPRDTTTKANRRLARNAHKMGEAPEIYDPELTGLSIVQLRQAMYNKGYFNATVDTATQVKKRKVKLVYTVHADEPYFIKQYSVSLPFAELRHIAEDRCPIAAGLQFDAHAMDEERQRISRRMRARGYYNFDQNLLCYEADSSYRTHEVAVRLKMQDYVDALPDSVQESIFTKYSIRHVFFHLDYDPTRVPADAQVMVEEDKKHAGYTYSSIGKRRLLRHNTLRHNCRIRPGDVYNEFLVERTYALLNSLGPVKYVDISFQPLSGDSLDCHITISRSKLNSVSAEVEGTYSAGDWGIAAGIGYINRNLFRGAEEFSLNARASYEWRQNGGRALEAKVSAALQWPNSLQLSLAYNFQQRPDEYARTIANAGIYYNYHRPRSHWSHRFNLLDISYVYLPWISEQFRTDILQRSSVLRYSYTDHFIMDWSYAGFYSNKRLTQPNRSYVNFNYSLETAGNFLYSLGKLCNFQTDSVGQYELFSVPFSQYAKADVNFTYHQVLTPEHRLVWHAAVGVAVPFLNASSVPFEKRYFAGGSNSVRGWQARTLGPGQYRGINGANSYDLQAGDIRLDLNLEYRWRVWSMIELAAFLDAGNIWTIRDYEMQQGGVFLWDEFYKQIAWSYGVGVRLDFSVLIFRVDFGVKLHDPTRIDEGTMWRTVPNGLCWRDDMTFHFAIGYPF